MRNRIVQMIDVRENIHVRRSIGHLSGRDSRLRSRHTESTGRQASVATVFGGGSLRIKPAKADRFWGDCQALLVDRTGQPALAAFDPRPALG